MSSIAPGTLAALALLIGVGAAMAANTYRWVDAQGVVHYSDTPQPGAQVVPLPSAQTYRAPPLPATVPPTDTTPAAPVAYQSCAITQPAADTELFAPETVSVSVQVVPSLRPGDQLSVNVDGAALPAIAGGGPLNFQLPQPERGQHTISAEIHDAQGQTVCSAVAVSFSVQRPSLLSPQSPAKGH